MRKKYFGDRAFYKMALTVSIPMMLQNFITNFVSLLDNFMVGAVGTEEMTAVSIVISRSLLPLQDFPEGCPAPGEARF